MDSLNKQHQQPCCHAKAVGLLQCLSVSSPRNCFQCTLAKGTARMKQPSTTAASTAAKRMVGHPMAGYFGASKIFEPLRLHNQQPETASLTSVPTPNTKVHKVSSRCSQVSTCGDQGRTPLKAISASSSHNAGRHGRCLTCFVDLGRISEIVFKHIHPERLQNHYRMTILHK